MAIKTLLNFDSWIGADEEPWEEESKKIDENWTDYFEFEGFETHESFQVMADFAESIDDTRLQNSVKFGVSTQNKHINGLISRWLGKPSLPILAKRSVQLPAQVLPDGTFYNS